MGSVLSLASKRGRSLTVGGQTSSVLTAGRWPLGRVITPKQIAALWKIKPPGRLSKKIPYNRETLGKCLEANCAGESWQLIYIPEFSFEEMVRQLGIIGDDNTSFSLEEIAKRQGIIKEEVVLAELPVRAIGEIAARVLQYQIFCLWNGIWARWEMEEEQEWIHDEPPSGYCLLNLCGQFGNKSWNEQEELIRQMSADLGMACERCHEKIVIMVAVFLFLAKRKRWPADWYHTGRNKDGFHRTVGYFDDQGLNIGREPNSFATPKHQVVISIRPN